jgi:hypothetical protein
VYGGIGYGAVLLAGGHSVLLMKPPPRVLVIRGGAIGDFILTLPAIRLLRETIAGCHLEVIGYPAIAELARAAGLADSVRSLEHRTMAAALRQNAPIDEALAEHLRSFNLVVSFLYDPDGLFRASMERVGVKTLIECSPRVQNEGDTPPNSSPKAWKSLRCSWRTNICTAHFERVSCGKTRVAIHHRQRLGEEKLAAGALAAARRRIFRPRGRFHHRRGRTGARREDCENHANWHALRLSELARPSCHLLRLSRPRQRHLASGRRVRCAVAAALWPHRSCRLGTATALGEPFMRWRVAIWPHWILSA